MSEAWFHLMRLFDEVDGRSRRRRYPTEAIRTGSARIRAGHDVIEKHPAKPGTGEPVDIEDLEAGFPRGQRGGLDREAFRHNAVGVEHHKIELQRPESLVSGVGQNKIGPAGFPVRFELVEFDTNGPVSRTYRPGSAYRQRGY